MSGKYDDLLGLPHPTSPKHPRMPVADRAAQFAPFAALTGYGDTISETARLTDSQIELTEESRELLDLKQRMLEEILHTEPEITVTFFVNDRRKAGGTYQTVTKALRWIDHVERKLVMTDHTVIPIDRILNLDHPMLRVFEET